MVPQIYWNRGLSDARLLGRGLEELQVVALGVLERSDATPWVATDFTNELDAGIGESNEFVVQTAVGLQGEYRATATVPMRRFPSVQTDSCPPRAPTPLQHH